jgi:hypothetical protein
MGIYTIKDLISFANRLPLKWQQSFVNNLEDWEAQCMIWSEKPETLSKDESTHAGIMLLANRLLGKDTKAILPKVNFESL